MLELTNAEKTIISEIRKRTIDRDTPLLVALDGRSGVGKSRMAARIGAEIGGVVIDTDKFYSGGNDDHWDSRTVEEKIDEVIDWRRLKTEVLEPLLARKVAVYHPFDFKTWAGLTKDAVILQPADVIILDGAYSSRPELADIIDLTVLVEVPDDSARRKRLIARESESYMTNWHSRWDDAEDYYFRKIRPSSSFDLRVFSE